MITVISCGNCSEKGDQILAEMMLEDHISHFMLVMMVFVSQSLNGIMA